MIKRKLEISEIEPMIRKCYESDNDLINKFHVIAGSGLDSCIKRTVSEFKEMNLTIYTLEKDGKFFGYFGDELYDSGRNLTGFFIMPEFRKDKTDFWKEVKNHFNEDVNIGIFTKNARASKFLLSGGCELIGKAMTKDGFCEVYRLYKEVI